MVSFKLVALLFVLLIGSFIVQGQNFNKKTSQCGPFQHFEKCGKPISCQPSCNESKGKVCLTVCTPNCVCNGGRVRNRFNRCVRPMECRRRRLKL